ncbi:MAG: SPFH domain-containing protein [Chthoniobacteraceae bacterium]
MGIIDFIKGQLLEIIEWTDDSRDTLSFRFPDQDKEIKRGAQLIVRESQVAQFVYVGQFGDTFLPGKYSLTTDNIPVLTTLASWKYGLESPFKADVYYVVTRTFTGNKWGTQNPIMMRDPDFGIVRLRAFGTYDFHIIEPKLFLKEVAGTDDHFRLDEFSDTMRSRIVSVFTDALATAKVPALDVASRYSELGRRPSTGHQSHPHCQVWPGDDQLRAGKRERAARGRGSDRQTLQHGGDWQFERLREAPDGAGHGPARGWQWRRFHGQ